MLMIMMTAAARVTITTTTTITTITTTSELGRKVMYGLKTERLKMALNHSMLEVITMT